jgi:hypothetical protein
MPRKTRKPPFATGQGLSLQVARGNVRRYLLDEQFCPERHGQSSRGTARKRKRRWRAFKRASVVNHIMAGGKFRRLAVGGGAVI